MSTSNYYINIPINACISLCLTDIPSNLTRDQVLAYLTEEVIFEGSELSYPTKHKEGVWEALHTVATKSDDVDINEESLD